MNNSKLFLICLNCSMLVGCNDGQLCEDCPDHLRLTCTAEYDEKCTQKDVVEWVLDKNAHTSVGAETCEFCIEELTSIDTEGMPARLSS